MSTETSVYETLESARSLMNDIAASAERRAEILLKNAELEADLITREAKESISRYTDEGNRLRGRVEMLRERYKKMLESELEKLEFHHTDILADFEQDFLPASMTPAENTAPAADKNEFAIEKLSAAASIEEDLKKTMVHVR